MEGLAEHLQGPTDPSLRRTLPCMRCVDRQQVPRERGGRPPGMASKIKRGVRVFLCSVKGLF